MNNINTINTNKIKLWCSPHTPLKEQGEGFTLLKDVNPTLYERITNCPSDEGELVNLAGDLLNFSKNINADIYQPGGSPILQFFLGELKERGFGYGVSVFYAHSERTSIETIENGVVKKISVFKHIKWLRA